MVQVLPIGIGDFISPSGLKCVLEGVSFQIVCTASFGGGVKTSILGDLGQYSIGSAFSRLLLATIVVNPSKFKFKLAVTGMRGHKRRDKEACTRSSPE